MCKSSVLLTISGAPSWKNEEEWSPTCESSFMLIWPEHLNWKSSIQPVLRSRCWKYWRHVAWKGAFENINGSKWVGRTCVISSNKPHVWPNVKPIICPLWQNLDKDWQLTLCATVSASVGTKTLLDYFEKLIIPLQQMLPLHWLIISHFPAL